MNQIRFIYSSLTIMFYPIKLSNKFFIVLGFKLWGWDNILADSAFVTAYENAVHYPKNASEAVPRHGSCPDIAISWPLCPVGGHPFVPYYGEMVEADYPSNGSLSC